MSNYKVLNINILSNNKVSDYVNTLGFEKVFIEIPSISSFCISATTNVYPIIYDSGRSTAASGYLVGLSTFIRYETDYSVLFNLNTQGNIILELPKSLSGVKNLGMYSTSTMTSTCTIRVHVSN